MKRVKWKGPIFYRNLTVKTENFSLLNTKIKIVPRFLEINPSFIGKTFLVHNGKSLIKLKIFFNMVGYKFGAFVFTKFPYIKKNKQWGKE